MSRYYDGFDLSILTHMAALYLSIELEGVSDPGAFNGNTMAVEDIIWYLHEKYTIENVCDDIFEYMKNLYGVEKSDCIKEIINIIANSKERNCMGHYLFAATEKIKSDIRYK